MVTKMLQLGRGGAVRVLFFLFTEKQILAIQENSINQKRRNYGKRK